MQLDSVTPLDYCRRYFPNPPNKPTQQTHPTNPYRDVPPNETIAPPCAFSSLKSVPLISCRTRLSPKSS
jgi:hypothetical protein